MNARILLRNSGFPIFFRSIQPSPLCLRVQQRFITADEKPLPKSETSAPGPNQEQLPHVSEEAAATGKVTGEGGPDIEQGTPVEEVCQA